MTVLLWAAGCGLFAVAAVGILYKVTQTGFLPQLGAWLVSTAWTYLSNSKGSPEARQRVKEGLENKESNR